MGLGSSEIILIIVLIIVIFGAKKLPEIGSGLGRAINNFKKASSEPEEIVITPKKPVEKAEPKKSNEEPKA